MVQGKKPGVSFLSEDGEAVLGVFATHGIGPNPGYGEGRVIGEMNEVRVFFIPGDLPFVKTIRRNQASSVPE